MRQSVVLLALASLQITIPVGFDFYQPDPRIKAWKAEENRLKAQGVAKENCPPKPDKDPVIRPSQS